MASNAAELKVRVGFLFDEKALAGIERSMRSSGQRLSRLGSDMTLAISAPLAALGVTAVKAAGDLESLTLALKSQLGSAEAAGRELELLNEAAKNPGLGLEQAVRGSVRLQGVGVAADEARETLIQMGNAIAATGGSAVELDNVTKQFAQMISKGRVLQEDVSILSENMPGLAQLMQQAFGTQSVEAIREMGVSGKEFVKRITEAAKELPRVEGGIKNNIGNAIDSLKVSAGKLGLALNNAFDISGNIDRLAGFIAAAADSFSQLDAGTQKLIIGLAGIAVAAGPLIKVFGVMKQTGAQFIGAFSSVDTVIGRLIGTAGMAEAAMTRLKVAFGIVGIVTALAFAVYQLSDNFDAAEFAAEKFADGQKAVIEQTSKEIGVLNRNFEALKDETKSRFDKGKVIDDLLKQYPEYLKGIDLEGASIERLTEIQKKLNGEILRGVAERQKATAVNSLYEKQAEIFLRIQQLKEGSAVTVSEAGLIDTGDMIKAGGIAEAVIQKMQAQFNELGTQIGVVEGQFDRAFGTLGKTLDPAIQKEYEARDAYYASRDALGEKTKTLNDNTGATDEARKMSEKYRDVLKGITAEVNNAKIFGEPEDIAKLDALRKGIVQLIEAGFNPASKAVQNLKTQYDALLASFSTPQIDTTNLPGLPTPTSVQSQSAGPALPTLQPVQGLGPDLEEAAQLAEAWKNTYITAAQEVAATVGQIWSNLAEQRDAREIASINAEYGARIAAAQGNAQLQAQIEAQKEAKIAEVRKKAARRAKIIALAEAAINTAVAITKAIASAPPPLNLPAIAAAKILGAAQIATIAATPFARGTSYAPGGVALVGEQGPELINLPRGSQVFPTPQTNQMLNGIGGGGVNVTGEFRVQGTDLVLVLERTQQKNQRFR